MPGGCQTRRLAFHMEDCVIGLVLTFDYEIFGTGTGDVIKQMTAPTQRLLRVADEFGVRVTIMADVAQILAWRREPAFHGAVERIEQQLVGALRGGHDVQLHLHPAWFRAQYRGGRWELAFDEYALPGLPAATIRRYVAEGAAYLNELGRGSRPDYACTAFRAGGWLIQPSDAVVPALLDAGIQLDTSVFRGGWGLIGRYALDFRAAPHAVRGWRADEHDVARARPGSALMEVPIFARQVPAFAMLIPRRLAYQRRLVRASGAVQSRQARIARGQRLSKVRLTYPKKFDFCRLGLRELTSFVAHADRLCRNSEQPVPVVAIGHSTEFIDELTLRKFLERVRRRWPDVSFPLLTEYLPNKCVVDLGVR